MAEGDSSVGPATGGPQPTGTDRGSDEGQIQTFLIADVRGYTLFSQEHGDEAAGRLAARFARVATQVIEVGGGSVLELRGDEALCIFSTTRRAIRAAIDLQTRLVAETESDPTLPLPVGIGIDTGEAVPVAGGFRGRALNLAARLCGSARAGEILATREALHMAGRMEGINAEDLGLLSFKNVPEPVGVVRITIDGVDPVAWFAERAPSAPTPKRISRRRRVAIASLASLLVAAVAIPLISTSGSASTSIEPNSVGVLDPDTGEITGTPINFASRPGAIATSAGSVWVAQPDAGTVARIDPSTEAIIDTVPVGKDPTALAAADDVVWVVESGGPTVSRISPGTGSIVSTIPVGNGPVDIAIGDGSAWVANRFDGTISRIDLNSEIVTTIPVGLDPEGIAFGFDSVWVSLAGSNSVVRLDPATNSMQPIPVGNGPGDLAIGADGVWVANTLGGTISRIDPATNAEAYATSVGNGPSAIAVVGTNVWVSSEGDGTLSHVEEGVPTSHTIATGSIPQDLANVGGHLWVTVRGSVTSHVGGMLRLASLDPPQSLDPRATYWGADWVVLHVIGDGLVGFKSVGGIDGGTLVPDLATALPLPSDGGRTYTFQLRPGIRYSNGEVVMPSDFLRAIEQGFLLNAYPHEAFYSGLVGGDECVAAPASCDLSEGIVSDDATGAITFHLVAPDTEFLYKLALPFAYPAPTSTPTREQIRVGVPGTGPYMVEQARSDEELTLVRNPFFQVWSSDAQPDGNVDSIGWTFGLEPSAQVDATAVGGVDVALDAFVSGRLDELFVRFPEQIHSTPQATTLYVIFDNDVPPFNDVRVRRAMNLALDRGRVVALRGGDKVVVPTCQQLPPNFPGYVAYCPYTVNPGPRGSGIWNGADFENALALIQRSGTSGIRVKVEFDHDWKPVADYLVKLLDRLGYQASAQHRTPDNFYNSHDAFQMKLGDGWAADYPAASNFIANRFTCEAPVPPPFGFCDPKIDGMIQRALRVQATDQTAAGELWAMIDRAIVDEAPYLWTVNQLNVDFVSERVGNYQRSPQWALLLDQLWVR